MKKTESAVLYRRYRPQEFSEVRGQEAVVKALTAEIKAKKPAHAYLFAGGRGTGKTSVARILAKDLGVAAEDIIEIDAASHTGVDHMRELREGTFTVPFNSPYKFYIIDEAHMLSKGAFNALLKTLEEPPSHVIFVLATTELDKIPETIRSRCEIHNFKQPTREMLVDVLGAIAEEEKRKIEKNALELVALLADGSFRDALSILQKVLSTYQASSDEKEISREHVEEIAGAPKNELLWKFVIALAKKDVAGALGALATAENESLDARTFARLVIYRLRRVLLLRYAPEVAKEMLSDFSPEDEEIAQSIVKESGISSSTLRSVLEAHAQINYAAAPFVPLELCAIDVCSAS